MKVSFRVPARERLAKPEISLQHFPHCFELIELARLLG